MDYLPSSTREVEDRYRGGIRISKRKDRIQKKNTRVKGEILLDLGGGEIAILFFQAPTERASLHGSTWGVVDV